MDALYPSNLQKLEAPVAAEVSLPPHNSHTRSKLLPNVTAAVTYGSSEPTLSEHPVDVGQRTEGAILSELVRRGYSILVPFGVNQRYDLVLDMGDDFVRAQCKTGRLRDGAIRFPTRSTQRNSQALSQRGYAGEAEVFLVYCPDNRRTYVVPVDEAPATGMYLRVSATVNRQTQGVRWAKDFELPG